MHTTCSHNDSSRTAAEDTIIVGRDHVVPGAGETGPDRTSSPSTNAAAAAAASPSAASSDKMKMENKEGDEDVVPEQEVVRRDEDVVPLEKFHSPAPHQNKEHIKEAREAHNVALGLHVMLSAMLQRREQEILKQVILEYDPLCTQFYFNEKRKFAFVTASSMQAKTSVTLNNPPKSI